MATQNATLTCTATGSSSFTAAPQVIKSATGTASLTLLKLTGHILSSPATHSIAITTLKYAYYLFDELTASNKWFISNAGRFTIKGIQRWALRVKDGL